MFKLCIRTNKKAGSAPLFTKMRIGGTPQWLNLLLTVDVEKWADISKSEKRVQNFLEKTGYEEKLLKMELGIKNLKRENALTKKAVENLIQDIVLEEQRRAQKAKEQLGKEFRARQMKSIEKYLEKFITDMETGAARNKSKEHYAPQTIKAWKQFKRIFLDFYHINPKGWDDIDENYINLFIAYLENGKYNKTTIRKYLRTFKQVIIDAEKSKYHANSTAKTLITLPKIEEHHKAKQIYLSKSEIEALFEMELDGTDDIARDLFLVGCYTAKRFSDFTGINESCIGVTAKGIDVIRQNQQKTGQFVVTAITDPNLISILKKYNYNLPYLTDQELNRTIKEVLCKLSKTVTSLAVKEITILKKQEIEAEERGVVEFERDRYGHVTKPRWQLVSTHTARRSCITNMYLSGKYTIPQMMSVSGHRTQSTFLEYVKLSLDEKAEMVAEASIDGLF